MRNPRRRAARLALAGLLLLAAAPASAQTPPQTPAEVPLPREEQPERLAQVLAEARTQILWDHLDALLPGGPEALPPGELRRLLDLGSGLAAQGAPKAPRLILTSDSPDLDHPD